MGNEAGVFSDKEVEGLSNEEKAKLRADAIKELLKSHNHLKLRENLAKKYPKIKKEG
jgi:hypothetical protein